MRLKALKCGLALSCGLLAVSGNAATPEKRADRPFADADHVVYSLARGAGQLPLKALSYHGGGSLRSPKVVFIFWGPSFNNAASPDFSYARELQADRNQFGSTPEWAVLQYYGIGAANLGSGTPDWFDTSTPPTNVTDPTVQAEVNRYFSGGHGAYNSSTIYEVVTPAGHYSSSGSSTSCGGRSLAYCAYHGFYSGSSGTVIYSIQPYPSCSGCKVSGWSDALNQEHFFCKETREATLDPVGGTGWYDNFTGEEPDDKCAWSPPPFIGTGGYGYQYEWVPNLGCIKSKP
jgi:hypothetical protein